MGTTAWCCLLWTSPGLFSITTAKLWTWRLEWQPRTSPTRRPSKKRSLNRQTSSPKSDVVESCHPRRTSDTNRFNHRTDQWAFGRRSDGAGCRRRVDVIHEGHRHLAGDALHPPRDRGGHCSRADVDYSALSAGADRLVHICEERARRGAHNQRAGLRRPGPRGRRLDFQDDHQAHPSGRHQYGHRPRNA